MNQELGQILPDSSFGKALTALAKHADVIVEIGTWRGGGSTRCLANGLERPEQRMWTIESDWSMHKEAKARYDDSRIKFIHAHALSIVDMIPEQIGLLLLDGDDFTTDQEFDALHERCKVIALDDSNEMKNKRQVLILKKLGWKLVAGSDTERNGWAIFERP